MFGRDSIPDHQILGIEGRARESSAPGKDQQAGESDFHRPSACAFHSASGRRICYPGLATTAATRGSARSSTTGRAAKIRTCTRASATQRSAAPGSQTSEAQEAARGVLQHRWRAHHSGRRVDTLANKSTGNWACVSETTSSRSQPWRICGGNAPRGRRYPQVSACR